MDARLEPSRVAAPMTKARRALVALLIAAVAVAALIRLPPALRDFDRRASFNATRDPIGRQIAGADAEGIDNTFLVQALALIPKHASYTVLLSQSPQVAQTYGIAAATYHALPGFVQNALLPRRQVDAARARYVLCYACNTDALDKRGMKRLWQNQHGLVIGELPH